MRKLVSPLLFLTLLTGAAITPGCGGGSSGSGDGVTISTSGNGSLAGVNIGPSAGSTFISRSANFVVGWPGSQPPSSFTAALHRYQIARGDAPRVDSTQKIEALNLGSNQWNIRRRDNFTLDGNGVYYLQLTAPGGQVTRTAYIVEETRAASDKVSRDIPTGGNGTIDNALISPGAGSVFIDRFTTFEVSWPSGATAPPSLGIDIYRYEEPRGGELRKVTKQNIDLEVVVDAKLYRVRVKNGMASGGVYYVELNGTGSSARRFAYIVSTN